MTRPGTPMAAPANPARLLPVAVAAIGLAACTSTARIGEQRTINVEGGATPAAAVLSGSMSSLVRQTGPSYVTLIVHEGQARIGLAVAESLPNALTSGSGYVVSTSGYILTAGHVALQRGNTVNARSNDGRIYNGKVVAVQHSPDIALIKLAGFTGIPVQPATSPCMRKGAAVFSLGKPHARGDTARIGQLESMSFGQPVSYNGFGYPDALVLRMNTRKGESGGPLFNAHGQLSGMVVSTLSDGNGRPLNLAHAISSPNLARFLCSKITCTARWKALSAKSTRMCSAR